MPKNLPMDFRQRSVFSTRYEMLQPATIAMGRRVFDESFRKMAIELSFTKGSVKEVADELGISQTLLSKWRQRNQNPGKEQLN